MVHMTKKVPAKALGAGDRSKAVLVSFDARWYDPIVGKTINAVLRKRIPIDANVQWIYFYLNAPHSVIPARAVIRRVRAIRITEALSNTKGLSLSKDEIATYSSGQQKIGVYELGRIEISKKSPSLRWLRSKMLFFPPQSFLFLSKRAKAIMDNYAGFK